MCRRLAGGYGEAAVVLLRIDDDKLEVRPLVRDEVLFVSAMPERARQLVTVERLATTPLILYEAESADTTPSAGNSPSTPRPMDLS